MQTRVDPTQLAAHLNVSQQAVDIYLDSDVIDLHVDSFIWTRLAGYALHKRHGPGLLRGRFFRQVDVPRIREARIAGATWVITTNPWRSKRGRARAFARNLKRLTEILEIQDREVQIVQNYTQYVHCKQSERHSAFLGIQGGNAIEARDAWDLISDGRILRVTLVHLTNSGLGYTSSPLRFGPDRGLSALGREFIEHLNSTNVLVDLAHASERTFWDALEVHDRSIPVLVSHTGIDAVHPHWRNLTDRQLRAVADTGGLVGVFFHGPFLGGGYLRGRVARVAQHISHAVRLVGAQHIAIGSDWDGMIVTPRDMPTCLELPRLVQALLNEHMSESDIQLVLGGSFLQLLRAVRP
jgi:membrane dipeptidase